jgi:hypothetical protein
MGNRKEIVLLYFTNTFIFTFIFIPRNEVINREFFVLLTLKIAYFTSVVSLITL